jgi:hypothetical protein
MKSTAYGKWFPRRIRPQNGHGNSVAAPVEGRAHSDEDFWEEVFNNLS